MMRTDPCSRGEMNKMAVKMTQIEAEQRKPRPVAAKAPREERLTPVSDVSVLTVGQALKVKAGNNAMDATVLEITKDGVRVQLTSGMSMIVRAEHLVF